MSHFSRPKGFNVFSMLVWTVFLAVAIYLFAWPLIEGMIIIHTWKKLPAFLPKDNAREEFFFSDNHTRYYSPRLNLWLIHNMDPVQAPPDAIDHAPNATCYVKEDSAGEVTMAVLDPQARLEFSVMLDRIAIAFLLFAAVFILDFKARRAKRSRQPRGAPSSPSSGVTP